MYEEKMKKKGAAPVDDLEKRLAARGLTKEQMREIMSQEAEKDLADSLFEVDLDKKCLKNEKDYENFGKQVANILYDGSAPYRLNVFFNQLFKELPKNLDSEKIKVSEQIL